MTLRARFFAASIAVASAGVAGFLTATPVAAAAMTDAASQTVIASGDWSKKTFSAKGGWSIVERDGKKFVVLDDAFRTRSGPDLKIFLSPTSADAVTGQNAVDGSLRVAELTSNKGAQEYELPADVDLSAYASIVIHCEAYSKLWVAAAL